MSVVLTYYRASLLHCSQPLTICQRLSDARPLSRRVQLRATMKYSYGLAGTVRTTMGAYQTRVVSGWWLLVAADSGIASTLPVVQSLAELILRINSFPQSNLFFSESPCLLALSGRRCPSRMLSTPSSMTCPSRRCRIGIRAG